MAGKYTRALVHLRKTTQNSYETAQFSECVLDYLGIPNTSQVECYLENNRLLIQPPVVSTLDDSTVNSVKNVHTAPSYKIMHPPFCPVHHLDEEGAKSLPPDIATRGVDVGVAVLLESSDGQLLLTRRAAHMRTFSGVWVPPGGHLEEGETLEEAALRELKEETGLSFDADERKGSSILGLWESVYPPILAMGSPKRHHIVIYFHILVSRSSEELITSFKLSPKEVDAAVWLSKELVKVAVWNLNEEDSNKQQPSLENEDKEKIYLTLVNKFGEHTSGILDSSILRNRTPTPDNNMERISTGSRFALSLWLEKLEGGSEGDLTHKNLYAKYEIKKDGAIGDTQIPKSGLKNKI